jgi:serine/threonine-protein kinase
MNHAPPPEIGKYQIIREIARSNDIVYEAYDPTMTRRVAVKELAFAPGGNDSQKQERVQRFLREARAAGSLQHTNIVTVYEVGEDINGRHYIAMEFLEGQTLRAILTQRGTLSPNEAVTIVAKVLDGLAFAHSKGVIHRDVKPENVQILPEGRVVITDFGIARMMFEQGITSNGQVFGTPSYMSPEQLQGAEIDPRSDIFGVGVMLYELLSGHKPFIGNNIAAVAVAITTHEPRVLTAVPPVLWSVICKALQKSKENRFSSAQEMSAALNQCLVPSIGSTGTQASSNSMGQAGSSNGQLLSGPSSSSGAPGQLMPQRAASSLPRRASNPIESLAIFGFSLAVIIGVAYVLSIRPVSATPPVNPPQEESQAVRAPVSEVPAYVGIYKVVLGGEQEMQMAEAEKALADLKAMNPEAAVGMPNPREMLDKMVLDLKEDGSFTITIPNAADISTASGTYSLRGDTIMFVAEFIDGKKAEGNDAKPESAKYDAATNTITLGSGTNQVSFKKA